MLRNKLMRKLSKSAMLVLVLSAMAASFASVGCDQASRSASPGKAETMRYHEGLWP
jgi:hypothetical protein